MNLKNKMKSYNLILLKKQKNLGKVFVADDYKQIEVKLNFSKQKKYQAVIKRLISTIRTDNNYTFTSNNLKLSGVPGAFWPIFTQKLMLRLEILVDEEKDKRALFQE